MASSGPNSGSTFANDAASGTRPWSGASNAASSNNSYATVASTAAFQAAQFLKCTGFGFSIPSGATIDGVVIEAEAKSSSGTLTVQGQLVVANAILPTSDIFTPSIGTTEAYSQCGTSTFLWGTTLTPAIVNDSGFGCAITLFFFGSGVTMSVDHVRMTVYYTEGGGGSSLLLQAMMQYSFSGGCL